MEVLTKEFTYKGRTKSFSSEIQVLPAFDSNTMSEEEYEMAKKEVYIEAEANVYDQKTEWIFRIEMGLED